MAVLEPVKLILTNVPHDFSHSIQAPLFPKDASKGSYEIKLTKEIYIDRSDILLEDSKDFYGFAPGKVVNLKYGFPIKVSQIITGDKHEIIAVHAEILKDSKEKPKGFVHWVPVKDSIEVEVRLYDILFLEYNPNELENWLDSFNPNSLVVKSNARIHKSLLGIANFIPSINVKIGSKHEDKFQFERVGFFSVDYDSDVEKGRYVFNKTVSLVDKEKQKAVSGMNLK